jgi:hypothetical protein
MADTGTRKTFVLSSTQLFTNFHFLKQQFVPFLPLLMITLAKLDGKTFTDIFKKERLNDY